MASRELPSFHMGDSSESDSEHLQVPRPSSTVYSGQVSSRLTDTAMPVEYLDHLASSMIDRHVTLAVEAAFRPRPTAELVKAVSWPAQLGHRTQTGYAGLPLCEYLAYHYVKQLESTRAPTAPGTCISAVDFRLYTLGAAKKRRDPKYPSILTLGQTVDIPCTSDPYEPSDIRLPSSPDSSSTSTSSSSESSDASSIDNEELDLIAKPCATDESFEGRDAYGPKTLAVLHCRLDDHARLKCGRMLAVTYSKIKWTDTPRILRCAQCF